MEFAIIATLLILLIFGLIEFGRTYSEYQVFLNAARQGARKGAVRAATADIEKAVLDSSAGYPRSEPPTITVDGSSTGADPPCNDDTVGQDLKVSWDQVFSIQVPFLPDFSPTVNIRGVFRCE